MSKIVFVLGAGASAHCGTPLMNNFLEVAEDLWRRGEVKEVAEHFERVFDAIGNLQGIHSKAKLDTYNIETIYAAFEMGKLLDSLPGVEENSQIEELISSIKKVIAYTLEQTTELRSSGTTDAPESYYEFAGILDSLIGGGKSCSIITFNYDVGLDYSLYRRGMLPDYGLGDIDLTNKKYITFLKLHGSLNWGKCTGCKKIIPYRQFQYINTVVGRAYSTIPIISPLKRQKCSCGKPGKPLEEDPFIVPPTWNKTAYHEQIEQVWKRAALELKDAENIFVLGYSLPSTDLFFNYLFALGVDMKTILKGFYVYNTDPTAKERFQNLLGSGIEQRFQFYNLPFEEAVRKISLLGIGILTVREILDID